MLFGESPIDPRSLFESLVEGVTLKVRNNEPWTKAVKDVLLEIGKKKGDYYVAPDPSVDQPEFLLDLLWFRDAKTNDIVLAVESEWGNKKNVLDDFGKLMHIKAPLKMMVLSTSRHGDQSKEVISGIQKLYMENFSQHVKGEVYLLVEFVHPELCAHSFLFEVPNDGKLQEVKFQQLSTIHYQA